MCACKRKRYKHKIKKAVTIQDQQFQNFQLFSILLRTIKSTCIPVSKHLKACKNNDEDFDPSLL